MPAEATLLADGSRASVEGAAFANAALMHVRAQDDAHTPSTSHPGATVTPPALAIAEAAGLPGRALLEAIVLGAEVQGRLGRHHSASSTPRGFRATTVYGVFGAASASARLLGASPAQTANALALAANLAGGLGRTWVEGTDEWRLQVGIAARNGIFAARMGLESLRTAALALEGRAGFLPAFAGTGEHASRVAEGLGERWSIGEVTLKAHPCCAILQGPVETLLGLVREFDLSPDDVVEVRAAFAPYEAQFPGNDNPGPFDSHGGTLMSAQFCLGLAIAERRISVDGLLRFDDPAVRALVPRIRVVSDPAMAIQCGRLVVVDTTGRVHERTWSGAAATPPARFDAVADRIRLLLDAEGPGVAVAERLIDAVAALPRARDVQALVSCAHLAAR